MTQEHQSEEYHEEQSHDTAEDYCCACSYDVATFKETLRRERERVIALCREKKNALHHSNDCQVRVDPFVNECWEDCQVEKVHTVLSQIIAALQKESV